VPSTRSKSSIVNAPATTDVAMRPRQAVTVRAHTKIGIRISDIPGARIRKTVTRKFTELRI
jgi:hypothetical protein